MEIDDDFIEAVEVLLKESNHQPDCPDLHDHEVEDCPCGYAAARTRVVKFLEKAKAHASVAAAMDF